MISRMRTHCQALFLLLATAGLLGSCSDTGREWQHGGTIMGTRYTVTIADCPPNTCTGKLTGKIDGELKNINRQMSHFDGDSELSGFNKLESTDWYPVSPELATVVELALSISELSDGMFDITVAPAVNAWGFGSQDVVAEAPSEEIIAEAVRHSGWQKIQIRSAPPALRKTDPKVTLDLSAIAKGFAVDRLAYLLEFDGVQNFLVEIGGEIRTVGLRGDGKPWRIGVERPGTGLDISFVITPRENAVATSGDYRNYRMLGSRRISHVINPQTGMPAATELASVTVVDASASNADALATTLMVMGAKKGVEFAAQNNIPALFIVRDGDTFRPIVMAEFEPYLAFD
jgi:thiamine biosynthesis lipoprotein